MPPPPYPPQALHQGVDGNVVLLVDVGADGKPTHVQVQHSQPAGVFDAAAVEAAKRWTFEPKRANGKAVASRVQVPVRFEAQAGPEH
jgi:TonB family protein